MLIRCLLESESKAFLGPIIYGVAVVSAGPALLLSFLLVGFTIVRSLLQLFQKLLLEVFDVASSPHTSPFAYGAGFISLLVLFMKLIDNISQWAFSSAVLQRL